MAILGVFIFANRSTMPPGRFSWRENPNAKPVGKGEPIPPKPLKCPRPDYSQVNGVEWIKGETVVTFVVNVDGTTSSAKISQSAHKELDAITIEAIKSWKFHPASEEGHPVRFKMKLISGYSPMPSLLLGPDIPLKRVSAAEALSIPKS